MRKNKATVYFVRNITFLDFILPEVSRNPQAVFIVLYQRNFLIPSFYKNIIETLDITLFYLHDSFSFAIALRILNRLSTLSAFGWVRALYETLYDNLADYVVRNLFQPLEPFIITSFIFDHDVNPVVPKLVTKLRLSYPAPTTFVSYPHGLQLYSNYRLNSYDLDRPVLPDFSFFDAIYVCNQRQSQDSFGNHIITWPFRYTYNGILFYLSFLLDSSSVTSCYPCVLFLMSCPQANQHIAEIPRVIHFLRLHFDGHFSCRPHPKTSAHLLKSLSISSYVSSFSNLYESLFHAGLVVTGITSALYDAYLLGKDIIFLCYLSSNQLHIDFHFDSIFLANSPCDLEAALAYYSKYSRLPSPSPLLP
jgi:hypothetical protein